MNNVYSIKIRLANENNAWDTVRKMEWADC